MAQHYKPIPDSNANWIIRHETSQYMGYSKLFINPVNSDTIFNKLTYRKILQHVVDNNYEYRGAFRNNYDGLVFYVPPNQNPVEEYLLFDFTAHMGDTIHDVALHYDTFFLGSYSLVVDTVNIIECGPYSLKCLFLSPAGQDPPYYNGDPLVWVESIGSLNSGILNSLECGLLMSSLVCMSTSDTIFYSNNFPNCFFTEPINLIYEPGICMLPVGIDNNRDFSDKISIYPNPFNNQIILENLPIGNNEIAIYDQMGSLLYLNSLESPVIMRFKINHELPRGLYILIINNKNKQLWKQIIIKQ
jgi:hypothetical protein